MNFLYLYCICFSSHSHILEVYVVCFGSGTSFILSSTWAYKRLIPHPYFVAAQCILLLFVPSALCTLQINRTWFGMEWFSATRAWMGNCMKDNIPAELFFGHSLRPLSSEYTSSGLDLLYSLRISLSIPPPKLSTFLFQVYLKAW